MTYDELVERVAKIVVNNNLFKVPSRTTAEEIIGTIHDALQEPDEKILDAYWIQSGESKEMRSRVHCRADNYWRVMLAASPLGEPK